VSKYDTSLRRPAPSAVRTAISLWREAPRTSTRFATFAHAISSTIATAPGQHEQCEALFVDRRSATSGCGIGLIASGRLLRAMKVST